MLQRFGGFDAHEAFGDEILQNPKNAFNASLSAHASFDAMKMWLTPIKVCVLTTTTCSWD